MRNEIFNQAINEIMKQEGHIYFDIDENNQIIAKEKIIEKIAIRYKELSEQWIDVNENLPEEHQDVLVYYYFNKKSYHFPDSQFIKESSYYNGRFECDEEVTHWRKLPELPQPPVK